MMEICFFLHFLLIFANFAAQVIVIKEFYITEEQPAGILVGRIDEPFQEFEQHNGGDIFYVNPRNGYIKTTKTIDRESLSESIQRDGYKFVLVLDGRLFVTVIVHITDINDNFPKFPANKVELIISEATPLNTDFQIEAAIDVDSASNSVTLYSIVAGDTYMNFDIITKSKQSLHLRVIKSLDYEQKEKDLTLNVSACDIGLRLCDYTHVRVQVTDENDNKPQFQQDSFYLSIYENVTIDTPVYEVIATDQDSGINGEVTYSLNDINDKFSINFLTGQVFIQNTLDAEKRASYLLIPIASDKGKPPLRNNCKVFVTVLDCNDNKPQVVILYFMSGDFHVFENEAVGTQIANISVWDEDKDSKNNQVTLNLLQGNEFFSLRYIKHSLYGIFVKKAVDREITDTMFMQLQASDNGNPVLSSVHNVTLRVKDVNDNPPVFNNSVYQVDILESAMKGLSLVTVQATDIDSGSNGDISYYLIEKNALLSINEKSGLVYLTNKVDREKTPFVVLNIMAQDNGKPHRVSYSVVNINVLDVNDNDPIFNSATVSFNIDENNEIGLLIGTVKAYDADIIGSETLLYSFKEHSQSFSVDKITGEIRALESYDREEKASYHLTVVATDGGNRQGFTQLTVHINDVNDYLPRFVAPFFNITVHENFPILKEAARVTAIDLDEGDSASMVYGSNNIGRSFSINTHTGAIILNRKLKAKKQNIYKFTVSVYPKNGNLEESNFAEVFIKVIAANTKPLVYEQAQYHFKMNENNQVGHLVGSVKARYAVSGSTNYISYEIVKGKRYNVVKEKLFSIDKNGIIRAEKSIDYEARNLFKLRVSATDTLNDIPRTLVTVFVRIIDENDNTPRFVMPNKHLKVSEGVAIGKKVYAFNAIDLDSEENGRVTYQILNKEVPFNVTYNTGQVVTTGSLDYEEVNSFDIRLEASDNGSPPHSSTITFHVDVIDVNDNPPMFTEPSYSVHVREDTKSGTALLKLDAYDFDSGKNKEFSFFMDQMYDYDQFLLLQGELILRKELDREVKNTHLIKVRVRDKGIPPLESETMVTVTVDDVNDEPPMFQYPSYKFEVLEETPPGKIAEIFALDDDDGDNGLFTYTLLNDNDKFKLEVRQYPYKSKYKFSCLILSLRSFDSEIDQQSYFLTIEATDFGEPKLSSSVVVEIVIKNINDEAPKFSRDLPYLGCVLHGTPENRLITNVSAIDTDVKPLSVMYEFVVLDSSMNDGLNFFGIDLWNGTVYTKTTIKTDQKIFELTVAVHEHSSNISLCNIQKVIIFVVPNKPRKFFKGNCIQLAISENQKLINIPISVLTPRKFSFTVTNYSLVEYKHNPFQIRPSTGVLQLKKQLNHKVRKFHQLIVAADGYEKHDKKVYTDQIVVNIYVVPTNRYEPFYPNNPESFTVLENVQSMVKIGSFKPVADNDVGMEGLCMYSIIETLPLNLSIKIIPPWSRDVYLVKPLDREVIKQYDLKVRVTDLAVDITQRVSNTFTLNLIVQDVNDNKPVFKSANHVKISEYQVINSTVFTVIAEDPDVGETHTDIVYLIVAGNTKETFKLDYQTGRLTVNRVLNIYDQQEHQLTIMAKELRNPKSFPSIASLNTTSVLTIKIIDVNDKVPKFSQKNYFSSIKEASPIGTFILQLNSSDADYKEEFKERKYELSDHADLFHMNASTGAVTSLVVFDHEADKSFIVNAIVSNIALPRGFDQCKLHISIEDINDHPPAFSNGNNIEIRLLENSPPGIIHSFAITDHDSGENAASVFKLNINKGSKKFAINSSTGDLYMLKRLDRERKSQYEFSVEVQNVNPPHLTAVQNVIVTLLDENDEKPRFSQRLYEGHLDEADVQQSAFMQVTAVDKDTGTNALVMYSIIKASAINVTQTFEINADTGEIKCKSPVDYEKQSEYKFQVQATGVGIDSFDVADVVIHVDDSNDNKPVFTKRVYEVNFHTMQLFMMLVKVQANDADSKGEQRLSYSIEPPNEIFDINSKTGEIRLMKTGIMLGQYHLNVKAIDQGFPPLHGFAKVFITIGNPNSSILSFLNSSVVFSIDENPKANLKLGTLKATSTQGGPITYSITESSNPYNAFDIGRYSGELIVSNRTVIDYELFHDFLLGIIASTRSENGYVSSYLEIVVNITDVNDNVPVILPYREKFIYTEQPISAKTYFLLYHVNDKDALDDGKLEIKILSGNEHQVFNILPGTLLMYIEKEIDYEKYKEFNLVVQVTDSATPPHHNESFLHIIVRDINDNPPSFNNLTPLNISESTLVGTIIKNVTVYDVDENSFERYHLISPPHALFQIDLYSGALILKQALDYEKERKYHLNISVYDGNFKVFGTLLINVMDANDNSPVFTQNNYVIPISSNLLKDTYITNVSATDIDQGINGRVKYKIHPPSDAFSILQETGVIFVNKDKIFSPEIDFYPLGVIAYDCGANSRSSSVTLKLSINGVANTFSPEFIKRFYDLSVTEGSQIGASLESVLAYFPRSKQRSMTYRIAQGNINNAFAVDPLTGLVTINNVLDREVLDVYALEIRADARESNMSAKCTMLIEIKDANDNQPMFEEHSYNISVPEGLPPGTHLIKVKAVDADDPKTKNGQVVYEIHSGQDKYEWLTIDRFSGDVTIQKTLDREVRSRIQLTIKASDYDGFGQTDFASLNVTVLDVNDNTPQFSVDVPNIYDLQVAENQPAGTIVFKAQAFDPDQGSNGRISFRLINTTFTSSFVMTDKDSGWVYTSVPLDYEAISLYNLTIVAQDHGHLQRSASFEYRISVKDLNEYKPLFTSTHYSFQIYANAPVHSSIGVLSATDNDGGEAGKIRYSFNEGVSEFYVNEVTGVILVKSDLRRRHTVRYKRDVRKVTDDVSEFRYTAKTDNYDNSTLCDYASIIIQVNYSCPDCILKTPVPHDTRDSFNASTTMIVITSIGICITVLVLACCFIYCRHKKTCIQKQKKAKRYFLDKTEIINDSSVLERVYLTGGTTSVDRIQNRIYNDFTAKDSIQESSETDLIQESSGTVRSVSVTDKASTFSFGIYHEQAIPESQLQPFNDALSDMSLKDLERNSVFGYPIVKGTRKAPSCISRSTQESSLYSIPSNRLAIMNKNSKVAPKRNRAVSHESLKDFQEEGGGEAAGGLDVGNLLYAKLADVDADEEEAVLDGVRPFQEEGELSHLGSLSTIMCDDDEMENTFNFSYPENWNNQCSELSPLFMKHMPSNGKIPNIPRNNADNSKSDIALGEMNNSRTNMLSSRGSIPRLTNHEVQGVYAGSISPSVRTPLPASANKNNFILGLSPAKSFDLSYPGILERSDSLASQLSKITLSDINISDEEDAL